MWNKHIVSLTDALTIEVNLGKGIKALKLKCNVLAGLGIKTHLVYRCAVLYPTVFVIIISIEDILDLSRIYKVSM